MRLYAFCGQHLKQAALTAQTYANNPFSEWMDIYASEEFQKAADTQDRLLDRLASCMMGSSGDGEEQLLKLHSLYSRAMVLERAFFAQVCTSA